jgi:hypothetical protein
MAYGPCLNALAFSRGQNSLLVVGQFGLCLGMLGVLGWAVWRHRRLTRAAHLRAGTRLAPFVIYSIEDDDPLATPHEEHNTTDEAPKRPFASADATAEHVLVGLTFLSQTLLCWSVLGPLLA